MLPGMPEAWEIEMVERARRVREMEEREVLRIPLVEHIRMICPECHGRGCESCGGRGTV